MVVFVAGDALARRRRSSATRNKINSHLASEIFGLASPAIVEASEIFDTKVVTCSYPHYLLFPSFF